MTRTWCRLPGLVPAMLLAESAGLHDLLAEQLSVTSPNAAVKAASVVGGMLAGADSIDDLDLLRHGGMDRLFAGVRAPSTLGTFLRSFTHGHVQQLDAVGAGLLAGLTGRVPGVIAGADTDQGLAFLDVDDTIREVHGYAKQGAGYGYTRVRGLNIQVATLSTPLAAPVIARARLRKGSTASAKGAGRMLAQAITTARAAGVKGQLLCRADSAYYGWAFVGAALRDEGVVLGHRPDDQDRDRRDRRHRRGRLAADQVPPRRLRRGRATLGLRRRGRRSRVRRVHRPPQGRTRALPAGRAPGQTAPTARLRRQPARRAVRRLPAPRVHHQHHLRHRRGRPAATATTRSWNRSSPNSRTGRWPTCPRASTPPTPPGSPCAVIAFNIARAAAVAADLAKARWATLRRKLINVPGPDRGHRPPARAAPTHPLALGRRLGSPARRRDQPTPTRDTLTTQPQQAQPEDPSGKAGQTGRPAAPTPKNDPPEPTRATTRNHGRWIRAEGALS